MKKFFRNLQVLLTVLLISTSIVGCAKDDSLTSSTESGGTYFVNDDDSGSSIKNEFDVEDASSAPTANENSVVSDNTSKNATVSKTSISNKNSAIKKTNSKTSKNSSTSSAQTSKTTTISQISASNQNSSIKKANTQTSKNTSTSSKLQTEKPDETTGSKNESKTESYFFSDNNSTESAADMQTVKKFSEPINEYEYKNIETAAGSNKYFAWMSVYCINNNSTNKTNFKNYFNSMFGFMPTADIQIKYIGEFLVDGYTDSQKIYQYTIEDNTYPLITDEFYVAKKKICADGSGWCGFPVPCSMENMDYSPRVMALLKEIRTMFCEWYKVDYSYVAANPDKYMTYMISEAGLMRTEDGKILDVVYHYFRGINMPIE